MVGIHRSHNVRQIPMVIRGGVGILLVAAALGLFATVSFAGKPQPADPSVVQAQVKKFGVGKEVKVKLLGGEKVGGHIHRIGAYSFTIRVDKSKSEREIPYDQVVQVKDPSPLTWMALGAAIVIVILVAAH